MMVTLTLARFRCDTNGCTSQWPEEGWAADRSIAWRQARAAGWARDYEQHRCPLHSVAAKLAEAVCALAGTMPDAAIGARVGLSRGQVQALRAEHGIPGRRPGRPSTLGQGA